MGYVGNQQTQGFSQVPAKQDLTGATGTSLTLTHAVASAEGIDLFINNVRQESGEAYSIGGDGVTVTLTGSVVGTDDIYVVYNSLARQTSTHPSNQALQATSGTFSGDLTVDTDTLYVDSTNNRLGIGTSSPSAKLSVNDANNIPIHMGDISAVPTSQTAAYVGVSTSSLTGGNGDLVLAPRTSDARSVVFYTGNGTSAERLRIDSSGRVTMPYQPCFYAYKSNGDISSTTPVVYVFNNSIVNVGNHYSTSTGRYTAGVAGNYHFSCQILNRNTTGGGRIHFYKNGSPYFIVGTSTSATFYGINGEATQGASAVIYLAAGDYVEIKVWNTNGDFYGSGNCHNSFSGFLIG